MHSLSDCCNVLNANKVKRKNSLQNSLTLNDSQKSIIRQVISHYFLILNNFHN